MLSAGNKERKSDALRVRWLMLERALLREGHSSNRLLFAFCGKWMRNPAWSSRLFYLACGCDQHLIFDRAHSCLASKFSCALSYIMMCVMSMGGIRMLQFWKGVK